MCIHSQSLFARGSGFLFSVPADRNVNSQCGIEALEVIYNLMSPYTCYAPRLRNSSGTHHTVMR